VSRNRANLSQDAAGSKSCTGAEGPAEPSPATMRDRSRTRDAHVRLLLVGLLIVLVAPLIVAVTVLHGKEWNPVGDLAQTELRVRDVGSGDTPLVGVPARIGRLGEKLGSSPGPLGLWAVWPTYHLLGETSWAMQVASASLHTLALGAILWMSHRRGGIPLLLGTSAVLAVLAGAYGASALTHPWNPYLPLLWWLVFLLAVWSVVCGDLPLLPAAAFAGSFCAQNHIPYLGLVLAIGGLAASTALVQAFVSPDPQMRRDLTRWALVAAAIGAVVWAPAVVDELSTEPGNLSLMWDHFRHPPEATAGLGRGVEVMLLHLDPWKLATTQLVGNELPVVAVPRPTLTMLAPGLLLVTAWVAAAAVAWKLRHAALARLHAVVATVLVLGTVSISRITGDVRSYFAFWAWGTTALVVLAVGWTAALLVGRRWSTGVSARAPPLGLLSITLVATGLFALDAVRLDVPDARLSRSLAEVVPPTVEALADNSARGGRDGRYFITWSDPVSIGAQGYGLMNELERHGFAVGTHESIRDWVTPHRAMDPEQATAIVHLSIGPDIEVWRAKAGVREVTYSTRGAGTSASSTNASVRGSSPTSGRSGSTTWSRSSRRGWAASCSGIDEFRRPRATGWCAWPGSGYRWQCSSDRVAARADRSRRVTQTAGHPR